MTTKKLTLDAKIYPLEAILNTCYVFLDRAYVFVDGDRGGKKIFVFMKKKTKSSSAVLPDEFLNELLHNTLRYTISKSNKKIREYIINRALCYPTVAQPSEPEKSEQLDYREDPLGIAIPWEKKYGKKRKLKSKV